MTWGKVSDDLHSHPKWTGASPNAKALWVTALSYTSGYLTDGHVNAADHLPTLAVETFGMTSTTMRKAKAAAAELVERGLWRETATGWRFHDWKDNNPSAAQVRRRRRTDSRRQWLHRTPEGKRLKKAVRSRDGDLCSWCGEPVRWGANRAPDGGTYDHVDPDGPDEPWNLVVSCNSCNGTKSDLDHDEIGFHLRTGHDLAYRWRPGGTRPTDPGPDSTRPGSDSVRTQSDRTQTAGTGRDGTGRDGTGRDGAGSGPGRAGTAPPDGAGGGPGVGDPSVEEGNA